MLRSNPVGKPWLVLKFGGTSIGKYLNFICTHIIPKLLDTHRIVIVCSARTGTVKEDGTSSRLLQAADLTLKRRSREYHRLVDQVMQDHCQAAWQSVRDYDKRMELESLVIEECRKLQVFLDAVEVIDEISPKTRDLIVATGERLACRLMTAALNDKGFDACYVGLENVIEPEATYGGLQMSVLDQKFYDHVSDHISRNIFLCEDRIPVVTGFFGLVPNGLLTSIGRGYTDLTAALIAAGIFAEELQIWKEVDGIFTADPRQVPRARRVPRVTPEEAAELTYFGSEVIHCIAMDQVIRKHIPIRLKNVQKPLNEGTLIIPRSSFNEFASEPHKKHPTAVTVKDNIWVLNVHSNRRRVIHGFFAEVFGCLDRYGIVVDLISTSEAHVSMAISVTTNGGPTYSGESSIGPERLQMAVRELSKHGHVEVHRNMAIVSLVGREMRHLVGIAANMFQLLADAGINIEIISQGASEINISCVVTAESAPMALKVIHDKLLIEEGAYDEEEERGEDLYEEYQSDSEQVTSQVELLDDGAPVGYSALNVSSLAGIAIPVTAKETTIIEQEGLVGEAVMAEEVVVGEVVVAEEAAEVTRAAIEEEEEEEEEEDTSAQIIETTREETTVVASKEVEQVTEKEEEIEENIEQVVEGHSIIVETVKETTTTNTTEEATKGHSICAVTDNADEMSMVAEKEETMIEKVQDV